MKSYGRSNSKSFKSFDSHTAASVFFVIFVLRLILAVVNNLVMEWCDQMDTAVSRGIEWHPPHKQNPSGMSCGPSSHVTFTSGAES
eukprot:CFRG5474T1